MEYYLTNKLKTSRTITVINIRCMRFDKCAPYIILTMLEPTNTTCIKLSKHYVRQYIVKVKNCTLFEMQDKWHMLQKMSICESIS